MTARGAYGLVIDPPLGDLPVVDATGWTRVRIDRRVDGRPAPPLRIGTRRAVRPLRSGGWVTLDRDGGTARYHTPVPLDDRSLAHPYLAPVAAIWAGWEGRVPLHGGAVVVDGRAVVVVGHREVGKSTLLAHAAVTGLGVLADDLAVVEVSGPAPVVLAGPRTVDLRRPVPGAAVVRDGLRHRLVLPPAPPAAPLGAVVVLTPGPAVSARALGAGERLRALAAHRSAPAPAADPRAWLAVVAVPWVEVTTPRTVAALGRLLDTLAAAP